jgi:ATP-binding cassette subfamily B protein/subfamily B ATP-binding cassette protein MsbA
VSRALWRGPLLAYVRTYRASIVGGCTLIVAQALVLVALPWPTKIAVDSLLQDRPLPTWAGWLDDVPGGNGTVGLLCILGAATVLLAVASALLDTVRRVWRRSLGLRMTNDLAHDTLELVQRRSHASFVHMRSGDLVQRVVTDTKCVDTLVFGVWMAAFQAVVTFVLLSGVMLSLSLPLAFVTVGAALPMLVIIRWFRPRLVTTATDLANAQAQVMTGAEQMLATLPEVQSFALEDAELQRFSEDSAQQLHVSVRTQRLAVRFRLAIGSVTAIGTGAVMLVGGLQVLDGALTVGALLVFLSYLGSISTPVEGLAALAQSSATARAGAERVLHLAAPDGEVPEPAHPVALPRAARGLEVNFDHVTFSYSPDRPVLEDVGLHLGEGETVALVGRTGAGKTTLASLIPRFFDPVSGTVELGGIDVRQFRLHDLRRQIAFVHQDPLLLPVSVAENISYGSGAHSDARVRRAVEHALATEFVESLPDGYDTVLGERGVTLSGGQRQRLAIARALYREAPILILDEPTAALDAETEMSLLDVVEQAAAGRTVLMIAHRLSTARRADRIVVLRDGRIVEEGTHDVLLELGGVYAGYASAHRTAHSGGDD